MMKQQRTEGVRRVFEQPNRQALADGVVTTGGNQRYLPKTITEDEIKTFENVIKESALRPQDRVRCGCCYPAAGAR